MRGSRVAGLPCPAACCPPQLVPQAPGHRRGCTARVPVERDDSAWRWQAEKPVAARRTADRIFYSYSRKCCKRWRVIGAEIAMRGESVGSGIHEKLFSAVAAAMKPCRWGAALVIHSMRVQAVTPDGAGGVQAQQMRRPLNPCNHRASVAQHVAWCRLAFSLSPGLAFGSQRPAAVQPRPASRHGAGGKLGRFS